MWENAAEAAATMAAETDGMLCRRSAIAAGSSRRLRRCARTGLRSGTCGLELAKSTKKGRKQVGIWKTLSRRRRENRIFGGSALKRGEQTFQDKEEDTNNLGETYEWKKSGRWLSMYAFHSGTWSM
jgi:hypothetical protein